MREKTTKRNYLPFDERVAVGKRLNTVVLDEKAHLFEKRGRYAWWLLSEQAIFGLRRHAAGQREFARVKPATVRIHAISEPIAIVVYVVVARHLDGHVASTPGPARIANALKSIQAGFLAQTVQIAAVRTVVYVTVAALVALRTSASAVHANAVLAAPRIASESRSFHAKRATPAILALGALLVQTVLANRAVDARPSFLTLARFGLHVEIASI